MGINLVAAFWGLAEATLFFIVPDVWLTIAGRKKLRTGLTACIYALTGALIGGVIIYLWAASNLNHAQTTIEKVPAISHDMISRVRSELSNQGFVAILLGPLRGTPYKVYAAQAADNGIGLGLFLLISIPARIIRFLIVTICCHFALKTLAKFNRKINSVAILLIGWIIFYTWYFQSTPG